MKIKDKKIVIKKKMILSEQDREDIADLRKIKNLVCGMIRNAKKSNTIDKKLIASVVRLRGNCIDGQLAAIEAENGNLAKWFGKIIKKIDILIEVAELKIIN